MSDLDFPITEIAAKCEELIAAGATIYQKFTCVGCGQRLMMEEPNRLYTEGSCDKCDTVTDIEAEGCNFLLVMGVE